MNDFHTLFDSLDGWQHQAAVCSDESAFVLAGPGAGKTRTLVAKALAEADGRDVYIMTFTVSAATEIAERIEVLTREHKDLRATIKHVGTLHSWALGLLRRYGDTRELVDDEALKEHAIDTAKRVRAKIPQKRLEQLQAGSEPVNASERAFVKAWRNDMREHRLLSYDMILEAAAELLGLMADKHELAPWAHSPVFLIDEAQDSSVHDLNIYDALKFMGARLWLVGDLQQSIYSFRHPQAAGVWNWALLRGFKRWELPSNYRSSVAVVTALNAINAEFRPRLESMSGGDVQGEVRLVECDVEGRVAGLIVKRIMDLRAQPEEVAVLCRTNRECQLLSRLLETDFPIRKKKERAVAVPERLWAALGYFRQPNSEWTARRYLRSIGGDDKAAVNRARKSMTTVGSGIFPALSGMERTPLEWMSWADMLLVPKSEQCWFLERVGEGWTDLGWDEILIRLFEAQATEEEGTGVTVTTVHSAKGREWRHVMMPFCDQHSYRPKNGLEEERVFFVGSSRAIETLTYFYAKSRVDEFRGPIEVTMCRALERVLETSRKTKN